MRPMSRGLELPERVQSAVVVAVGLAWLLGAGSVAAHGGAPPVPPSPSNLVFGWTFEPWPTLGMVAALVWWRWAVRRVAASHPDNPVPRRRTVAFVLGMAALAVALLSGIGAYDTTLFSVHMVQHILLIMVAPPLFAYAAPITLVLRVSSPETRKRWILPVLHSRVVRFLAFPVVAWLIFAAVMWVSHFSPLFDAALEDPLIHEIEHILFLTAGLLFWWPAVAQDPVPWRMSHPARALYVFLQMPQNSFLAVVLLGASAAIYPHYTSFQLSWYPDPLEDQRLAAGLMWLVGDLIFLATVLLILYGWMRAESRDSQRIDRRAAVELAEIRVREERLAERRAREREEPQPGSGAAR